jgi:hypothetical protein
VTSASPRCSCSGTTATAAGGFLSNVLRRAHEVHASRRQSAVRGARKEYPH